MQDEEQEKEMIRMILVIFVFCSDVESVSTHKKIMTFVDNKVEAINLILDGKIWRKHSTVINYFEKAELWFLSEDGEIVKKELLNYDFLENGNLNNSYFVKEQELKKGDKNV